MYACTPVYFLLSTSREQKEPRVEIEVQTNGTSENKLKSPIQFNIIVNGLTSTNTLFSIKVKRQVTQSIYEYNRVFLRPYKE